MPSTGKTVLLLVLASATLAARAQEPDGKPEVAPLERQDLGVDVAAQWIGRALFLRCFCAENNLTFDATGLPFSEAAVNRYFAAASAAFASSP